MCVCFQVDPGSTGRVGPTEAALFLKKSGLPDITLGKVGSGCSSMLVVTTVVMLRGNSWDVFADCI